MSTMPSKRRPRQDAEFAGQPSDEVVDRLAGLLPDGALDDAVPGAAP